MLSSDTSLATLLPKLRTSHVFVNWFITDVGIQQLATGVDGSLASDNQADVLGIRFSILRYPNKLRFSQRAATFAWVASPRATDG
eukprot:SM000167S02986  [mRNA]  locus=s167:201925:205751:- [translate_table: standard]